MYIARAAQNRCTQVPDAACAQRLTKAWVAALTVARYYLCRWEVELSFKLLKSGCQVEKLYLSTADRLRKGLGV